MRKEFFIWIFGIFLINLVMGFSVCIDHDAPTWPENTLLNITEINENEVLIQWPNATDEPSCSGVEYYELYKGDGENATLIEKVEGNSFLDENPLEGISFYLIVAVDRAGHNEGKGLLGILIRENGDEDSGGNGGSSGGSISGRDDESGFNNVDNYVENCSEWTECNELSVQTQTCNTSTGTTIVKTRSCEFEPGEGNNNLNESDNNESETGQETEETSGFLSLTGNVIRATGETVSKPQVAIPLGAILLGGMVFIFVKKRKKKNK